MVGREARDWASWKEEEEEYKFDHKEKVFEQEKTRYELDMYNS